MKKGVADMEICMFALHFGVMRFHVRVKRWFLMGHTVFLVVVASEVLTGFFCEHAFEMARTEKESLIQDRLAAG